MYRYVPIDGAVTPEETLKHIIVDSGAAIILCLPKFFSKVNLCLPENFGGGTNVLALDSASILWTTGNRTRPLVNSQSTHGCYCIYTSGTTGKPKGVDVLHQNVTNSLLVGPGKLEITVGKNVIQQLNVAFDLCKYSYRLSNDRADDLGAWEILATLMNGGTLHIRGSGNEAWAECLRRVDTTVATPSVALKHFPRPEDFPNIKTIAVGGEPCPQSCTYDHSSMVFNLLSPVGVRICDYSQLVSDFGGKLCSTSLWKQNWDLKLRYLKY